MCQTMVKRHVKRQYSLLAMDVMVI